VDKQKIVTDILDNNCRCEQSEFHPKLASLILSALEEKQPRQKIEQLPEGDDDISWKNIVDKVRELVINSWEE